MIDLGKMQEELKLLEQIEDTINDKLTSCGFRNALFQDPIGTLKGEGIILPPEREQAITDFFKNVKVPDDANLRVASDLVQRAPGDLKARISISIGIRF